MEDKRPRSTYKNCIVPKCGVTTTRYPNNLYFGLPRSAEYRKKWFTAMRRKDTFAHKTNSCICQDHFDLQEDMQNYHAWTLAGHRPKLRPDVVPRFFECQGRSVNNKRRVQSEARRNKRMVEELLAGSEVTSYETNPTTEASSKSGHPVKSYYERVTKKTNCNRKLLEGEIMLEYLVEQSMEINEEETIEPLEAFDQIWLPNNINTENLNIDFPNACIKVEIEESQPEHQEIDVSYVEVELNEQESDCQFTSNVLEHKIEKDTECFETCDVIGGEDEKKAVIGCGQLLTASDPQLNMPCRVMLDQGAITHYLASQSLSCNTHEKQHFKKSTPSSRKRVETKRRYLKKKQNSTSHNKDIFLEPSNCEDGINKPSRCSNCSSYFTMEQFMKHVCQNTESTKVIQCTESTLSSEKSNTITELPSIMQTENTDNLLH